MPYDPGGGLINGANLVGGLIRQSRDTQDYITGMFDAAARRQAGGLLASGDRAGAQGVLNARGLLPDAEQLRSADETTRVREAAMASQAGQDQRAERAEQMQLLGRLASSLRQVPLAQRQEAFQQHIAPALRAMGFPDDALGQVDAAHLTDEALQQFETLTGQIPEMSTWTDPNTGSLYGVDRRGETRLLHQGTPTWRLVPGAGPNGENAWVAPPGWAPGAGGQPGLAAPPAATEGDRAAPGTLNDSSRDMLARLLIGEAPEGEGQVAVANVVFNRATASGRSVEDEITRPHQFEPYGNRARWRELQAIPRDDPRYVAALEAIDRAQQADLTNGATHFYSPSVMAERGGAPTWAEGHDGPNIGGNVFLRLPYGGRRGGGSPASTPARQTAESGGATQSGGAVQLPSGQWVVPVPPSAAERRQAERQDAADRRADAAERRAEEAARRQAAEDARRNTPERILTPAEVRQRGLDPNFTYQLSANNHITPLPRSQPRVTQAQRTSAGYANNALGGLDHLNQLAARGIHAPTAQVLISERNGVTQLVARNPADAAWVAAANEFLIPVLRDQTGAAVTEGELRSYMTTYLPLPGDSPQVQQQKAEARARLVRSLVGRSGPAFEEMFGPVPAWRSVGPLGIIGADGRSQPRQRGPFDGASASSGQPAPRAAPRPAPARPSSTPALPPGVRVISVR